MKIRYENVLCKRKKVITRARERECVSYGLHAVVVTKNSGWSLNEQNVVIKSFITPRTKHGNDNVLLFSTCTSRINYSLEGKKKKMKTRFDGIRDPRTDSNASVIRKN